MKKLLEFLEESFITIKENDRDEMIVESTLKKMYDFIGAYLEEKKAKQEEPSIGKYERLRRAKPIKQYDLEGNFIRTWASASEAARELGICSVGINSALKQRGYYKSAGGYQWRYA